ncbi:hypothetical protein [Micromonospora okii]|uniref:hypothetical protein n=1 Tax=Micromonospora okii TaxID=1182970 RepID=UPI001E334838|nr:hypothetical protein [Micromonospora okii]
MTTSEALVLRVTSRRYAAHHPAWHDQVALLGRDLRELRPAPGAPADGVPLRVRVGSPAPVDGPTKGLVEVGAVVLASAQMVHAAALIIREWAKLDATREFSVELEREDGTTVLKGRGGPGIEAVRDALRAHLAADPPVAVPSIVADPPAAAVPSIAAPPQREPADVEPADDR